MTRVEIEAEIARLEGEIGTYNWLIGQANSELWRVAEVIGILQAKRGEIVNGIQESYNTIERKMANVNINSKFRTTYLEKAKEILWNSNATNAIEMTNNSETAANMRYQEIERNLSQYRSNLRAAEQDIGWLKQQLNQIGE